MASNTAVVAVVVVARPRRPPHPGDDAVTAISLFAGAARRDGAVMGVQEKTV
jgi:hypothetical protein